MVDTKDNQKTSVTSDQAEDRSIEDILASIRNMIADEIASSERVNDRKYKSHGAMLDEKERNSEMEGQEAKLERPGRMDILDLTEEVDENGNVIPNSNESNRVSPEEEKSFENDDDKPLITATNESVSVNAFASLTSHINRNDGRGSNIKDDNSGANPTLEDIVKTILRPMLQEWLDKNLEQIVKGFVKKEIERISSLSSRK